MATRSRGYNQDWDPMREDYDNSIYDPQNADESGSGFGNLDHCRLYITNIPNGLSDDGLSTAFSKYGQLTEVFVSRNPDKRYAIVAFETPGEAKFAMMKLNRTEPLRLNINFAKSTGRSKRPFDKNDSSGYRNNNSNPRNREDRSLRDNGSAGSRSNARKQESLPNGDKMEDMVEVNDDVVHQVVSGSLEANVNVELEELQLQHLKLQAEQVLCRQRILLSKQAEKNASFSSRQLLPDGRIVVRTIDKSEATDADGSFGAGDAPNLPALQTGGACVACGERSTAFCGGCRITPYCSPACQRRDWANRHKNVCHNLKRQSAGVASRLNNGSEPVIPAAAPLRRPRSPAGTNSGAHSGADRMPPKKFGPPGSATVPSPVVRAHNARISDDRGRPDNRGQDNRGSDNRDSDNRGRSDNSQDNRGSDNRAKFNRSNDGDDNRSRPNDTSKDYFGCKNESRKNDRQDNRPRNQEGARSGKEDEDWGPAPSFKPKAAVTKEEPKFEPKVAALTISASERLARYVKAPVAHAPAPVCSSRPDTAPAAAAAACAPAPARPGTAAAAPNATLVPTNCVIDLLRVGDNFMLSVDSAAESCASADGYVCVSIHEDYADNFERLLEPFEQACEASQVFEPAPGDTFAYLEVSEGAWYRARRLSATHAALLDAARLVAIHPGGKCRSLPRDFAAFPEFCAHLKNDKVQLKDQVQCTIVSKSGSTLTVDVVSLDTGDALGTGTVRRWLPRVDSPPPAPASAPAPAPAPPAAGPSGAAEVPRVCRPPVSDNGSYVLVDATAPDRVFVRPAARAQLREFNEILQEVALYGMAEDTPRLKELPTVGQTVVAQFTDGVHYRALVQRVSSKHRRCLLEYIEYGNAMVVEDLESLCPCPEGLSPDARPTLTSHVTLQMKQEAFSEDATAYLDKLKDNDTELTLSIPSGEKTGPCKAPVRLTVTESKEEVNRRVDSLSTPEWQKLLERGGDVLETERLIYDEIVTYVDPPASGGEMVILDCSMLQHGMLSGHLKDAEHARKAFTLTPRLQEYCNSALARDPYLPKPEECCIAKCPIKDQWLRAVLMEQVGGPGGACAQVMFFDYGHVATLPVAALRKMMPEFVRGIPAAVSLLLIKEFPEAPTPVQLERARQHMQVGADGVGVLRVTRVVRQDKGEVLVTAPDLLQALQ